MTTVFAGNQRQAIDYMQRMGIKLNKKFHYIYDQASVLGLKRGQVVYLIGTYKQNPFYEEFVRLAKEKDFMLVPDTR